MMTVGEPGGRRSVRRLPGWLVPTASVLLVVGLALSAYLTFEHFSQSATLSCPPGEVFDCMKVTTSSYSYLFGIPVAPLGLAYFVGMTGLCLPAMWQRARLDLLRLIGGVLGVGFVVYLIWAEVQLGAICLWCTGVHAITFVLFCVILFGQILIEPDSAA